MEEIQLVTENGIERGSGNVYAELGLPDPEGLMAKSHMILAITDAIEARKLSPARFAKLVGLTKIEASEMLRGPRDEFPVERLAGVLTALDYDVTFTIRERPREDDRAARILVETA